MLRSLVGSEMCIRDSISTYVPGISRLPRYVYVDTYVPGLHPQKKTEGLLMKLLQKNKTKINNRNTELCHHRPRSKAHSNEYENSEDKAEQSLPAWRGAGRSSRGTKPLLSVPAAVVFACQETCGPHGRAYEFRQDRQPWKIIHDEGSVSYTHLTLPTTPYV